MSCLPLSGGDANLAFREDEELKPYRKKSCASMLSASLNDDSFTIPAWKDGALQQPPSTDRCQAAAGNRHVMQANIAQPADISAMSDCSPQHSLYPAAKPSLADTSSQTSPR